MKQFAILVAALCTIGMTAGESQAEHHRGHHHQTYRVPSSSGFSFSIGNGFNGFSYSNLRPGYGYGYGVPAYRPPVYRYGGYGGHGGGFYGGYGRGYYGGRGYGCGW